MAAPQEDPLPAWTWRLLGFAAVGLLLAAVLGIALISAGVFDPRPAGPLQETHVPGQTSVDAGQRDARWLEQPLPQAPFSARLLAAHASGEQDVAYGLLLGESPAGTTRDPAEYLAVAVSPLGYVAVWQETGAGGAERTEHMPWQTWPHVRRGDAANEIDVQIEGGVATVRLNRELLWQGPVGDAPNRVGLYAESFGSAATVDFQQLALFYGD